MAIVSTTNPRLPDEPFSKSSCRPLGIAATDAYALDAKVVRPTAPAMEIFDAFCRPGISISRHQLKREDQSAIARIRGVE